MARREDQTCIWDLGQAAESWAKGDLYATRPQPEDLAPGWEEMMLKGFSEGRGPAEIWVALPMMNGKRRLTRVTWKRFIEKDEYFAAVVSFGKDLYRAYWERLGRVHIKDKDFNHVMWFMNMKNRHKWRDRLEQTIPEDMGRKVFAKQPDSKEWLDKFKPKSSGARKQARKPH